jgi:hypothetical protein
MNLFETPQDVLKILKISEADFESFIMERITLA